MVREKSDVHAPGRYIAFISYAREDVAFARQLESAIEAHQSVQHGAVLSVFRDESDFTGAEYTHALEGHLRDSKSLIVICSPSACASGYVADEIQRFARLNGNERIFPVLIAGLPNDEADALKSFPKALVDVVGKTPLAQDFRDFASAGRGFGDARFESEWFKLLANLQDASPADIRADDKQRQVRAARKRMFAFAALAIGMLAVVIAMFWLWQQARVQRQRAEVAQARAEQAEARAKEMSDKAETELAVKDRQSMSESVTPAARGDAVRAAPATEAPATSPPSPPSVVKSEPQARVYFHIRDPNQIAYANQLKTRLQERGFLVPGIQTLRVGPSASELRYFRERDAPEARAIAGALDAQGLVVKLIPGYENSTDIRPRHFELWLAPPGS